MKTLIMGGTSDALSIAQSLIAAQNNVTYSIAGIVRQPVLNCRVLSGGFRVQKTPTGVQHFDTGAEGLQWHLEGDGYDLIIDATHPYALQISNNIMTASKQAGVPVWRYLRPAWSKADWATPEQTHWREFSSLDEIIAQLKPYQSPFFTVGREVFAKTDLREPGQHWLVRSAGIETAITNNTHKITELKAVGPFKLEDELALFKAHGVDVLISKNSGGEAVAAKIEAARQLDIPVFLLARPNKSPADLSFSSVAALIEQINNHLA